LVGPDKLTLAALAALTQVPPFAVLLLKMLSAMVACKAYKQTAFNIPVNKHWASTLEAALEAPPGHRLNQVWRCCYLWLRTTLQLHSSGRNNNGNSNGIKQRKKNSGSLALAFLST
jgi:hypothetical protein